MPARRTRRRPQAARIEMTRRTLAELVRTLSAWSAVYRQPGAVFLRGSFYCAHSQTAVAGGLPSVYGSLSSKAALSPIDVADPLDLALNVLARARVTKHRAIVNMLDTSDDELNALIWVSNNCRVQHRGQSKAIGRIGLSALDYSERPPLMKLADCAE